MQLKRLLDDREVFAGGRLLDAQGRSYAFVEHSGGELVVTTEDGCTAQLKPKQLGAMLFTYTGLIEGWLKSDLLITGRFRGIRRVPVAKTDLGYWCGYD